MKADRGPDVRRVVTTDDVNAHANPACVSTQQSVVDSNAPIAAAINQINGARQLLKLVPSVYAGSFEPGQDLWVLLKGVERNLLMAALLLREPPSTLELEEMHADGSRILESSACTSARDPEQLELPALELVR